MLQTLLSTGLTTPFLAVTGWEMLWWFLFVVTILVALILVLVILIQDPKGGGLASAFGAGPSGDSLLGAQAQRDITRITTYLAGILGLLILSLVLIDNHFVAAQSAGLEGAGREEPVVEGVDGATSPDGEGVLPPGEPGTAPPSPAPEGDSDAGSASVDADAATSSGNGSAGDTSPTSDGDATPAGDPEN